MKRIRALVLAYLFTIGVLAPIQVLAAENIFRVTLLGTGNPIPTPDRFGPATLVEAGDKKLLFDAGRGATIRLYQLQIPLRVIDPVFLTHLHSDHIVGIPDLWLSGWLPGPWARRSSPLHLIGPTGTKELMTNLQRAYTADIAIRIVDEKLPPDGAAIITQEFTQGGVVYDKDGVKVTAFEVDHGEHIKPTYGYRIDYAGHSVVISGDTRFNENVIKYAAGADLLIHEVAAVRPEIASEPAVARVMAHHTSPQEAGTVFTRTHPKLAVYTHFTLLSRPNVASITTQELVTQTRETYNGPLEIGEDLMVIDVANARVIKKAE